MGYYDISTFTDTYFIILLLLLLLQLEATGAQWGFDGRCRYAHSGMLKAALAIRTELDASGTLNKIYGTTSSSSASTVSNSLAAATAAAAALETPLTEVEAANAVDTVNSTSSTMVIYFDSNEFIIYICLNLIVYYINL